MNTHSNLVALITRLSRINTRNARYSIGRNAPMLKAYVYACGDTCPLALINIEFIPTRYQNNTRHYAFKTAHIKLDKPLDVALLAHTLRCAYRESKA